MKGSIQNLVMLVSCVAVLSGYATAPAYRIENGEIVVESPFALEIGSTEYAKAFRGVENICVICKKFSFTGAGRQS